MKHSHASPFFVTIPHSGEKIPEACPWLRSLDQEVLYSDVDRWVDELYAPALADNDIPYVKADWHRYAVDLNRGPSDIDSSVVEGAAERDPNRLPGGFHWAKTISGAVLMKEPMTKEAHASLVAQVYEPFHAAIKKQYETFFNRGEKKVFQLDLHSMPSIGTKEHRDPGEHRADIVVSDQRGRSAENFFVDLALASFSRVGFEVRYNWPYYGGKITEMYGHPAEGRNVIQVELNRSLYMNESTKEKKPELCEKLQAQLGEAMAYLCENLQD